MEMLNSFNMLLKGDMWTTLISFFADWIINYGWAIVVFTICLKLVLLPLDIFQRISSQKQAKVTALMQPELNEINQKYANDKEKINQESAKLYKKYNVNVGGMCLTMLITLGVTMGVFFTLFASLRTYGNEKLHDSYKQLETAYVQAETSWESSDKTTEKDVYVINVVKDKYEELSKRNSWLWVKNVWNADASNVNQFVSFNSYANYMKLEENSDEWNAAKGRYDIITAAIIKDEGSANGYYILLVLAVAVSFLTQFLSAKLLAPKGQKMNTMNKVMLVIIPLSMAMFASSSNVVFTLYIITNSIVSAAISTILSLIFKAKSKGGDDGKVLVKKKNVEVVEYSRNYKK